MGQSIVPQRDIAVFIDMEYTKMPEAFIWQRLSVLS